MVNWNDLSKMLERSATMRLKSLELHTTGEVEHFPLAAAAGAAVAASVPLVPVAMKIPAAPPAAPAPSAPVTPQNRIETVVAAAPKPEMKAPVAAKQTIDPIVLGISLVDPLYEGAPFTTRQAIEKEVAVKLESQLDELYKTNSGRSRGWTKVGLEGMIKPRCASGGDLKELDRAKKPFLWSVAAEDKVMSAFLDFVCCARRIHCAILDAEKHVAYLYPAADAVNLEKEEGGVSNAAPLFVVDSTGHPMFNLRNGGELLAYLDKNRIKLQPPHSVTHSLSGLKLDELESVGLKLGMPCVEGKKEARVAAIAEFKTRARLTA